MEPAVRQRKIEELARLRDRVWELERELAGAEEQWPPREYYTMYYATTGFFLGMFGAVASLLFNVIGSLVVGQHPLKLIQIYLTFPLAERALTLNDGLTLAIGCCLYLATGMVLGIPFQLLVSRFSPDGGFLGRFALATLFGVVLWLINFYAILFWLQPYLFGGNWIVREIPWWVALGTHLVFAWTMALVFPLGSFTPYRSHTELT